MGMVKPGQLGGFPGSLRLLTRLLRAACGLQVQDSPLAHDLVVRNGSIEFRQVVFGYTLANPVLHGVSFKLPGTKTLAVVGSTGSGKSTILRYLICLCIVFFDL